jgi:hypothetical protein
VAEIALAIVATEGGGLQRGLVRSSEPMEVSQLCTRQVRVNVPLQSDVTGLRSEIGVCSIAYQNARVNAPDI